MYAKLFSRITESSLMEEPINVRYTFVLMLAIADPEGVVVGTDVAIARRLNMPLDEFLECLAVLMAPDPHSNSKELDGRRITVSAGERGYHIVNFVSYRDLKDPNDRREYMREYMKKYRSKSSQPAEETGLADSVNLRKQQLAELTHAEADADADADANADPLTPKGESGRVAPKRVKDKPLIKIPESLESPEFRAAWAAWEVHRVEKRSKLTPSTVEKQIKMLAALGVTKAVATIEHSIEKGWTGLFQPEDTGSSGKSKPVPKYGGAGKF